MDSLYNEVIEELFDALKNYSEDKASYEDLYKAFLSEDLVFNNFKWDEKEDEIRFELFEYQKTLYSHLRKVEQTSKNIKKEMEGQDEEICVDHISSHGRMISRNKMPLEGYSNSNWYLPHCPNHNHIEALYETEDE